MQLFSTVQEMHEYSREQRALGKSIGFVPTMGCLHEGHLTLMKEAKKNCDVVIASVFVNPIQFGPNEDYDAYPRQIERDALALEQVGVDALFCPSVKEMYPKGYHTYIEVENEFTNKLCGAKRPGHFRGVATVVTKLMNITAAEHAFFGQKDAQQVVVLSRVVADLNLPIQIHMVPIVREPSGLAYSSRNAYLSSIEKKQALILSQSLQKAKTAYLAGERNRECLIQVVTETLAQEKMAVVDYVQAYTFPELEEFSSYTGKIIIAIAVYIGKTRLIDNIILGE